MHLQKRQSIIFLANFSIFHALGLFYTASPVLSISSLSCPGKEGVGEEKKERKEAQVPQLVKYLSHRPELPPNKSCAPEPVNLSARGGGGCADTDRSLELTD